MKKFVITSVLAVSSMLATAADLTVSHVRDFNLDQNGVRVEGSMGQLFGVKPTLSVTHVNNTYTRYAVGTSMNLFKVGPVGMSVNGAGLYQDSRAGQNGYALTVGAKATMNLTKNVALNAGVERFFGQDRVNGFNGNVSSVGVTVKF